MTTIDERVSFLEGRVEEQSSILRDIRESLAGFEHRMERRFDRVDERLSTFEQRVDDRFTQVDARFAQVDARFAQVDARFVQIDQRFLGIDERFASTEDKIDRHFTWLVGILATTLAALLVALLTH